MNPFDAMNRKHRGGEEQRAVEDAKYEHGRVDHMLKRFKLTASRRAMMNARAASTGQAQLTFDDFNDRFPTFPFAMAAHRLRGVACLGKKGQATPDDYQVHRDPNATEPARFKKFMRVPFVAAYLEVLAYRQDLADPRPLAMTFPRKGFLHGMVIHNDDSERYWHDGLCWVYKGEDEGRAVRYYVQPFSALIEAIFDDGRGWRP